MDLQKTMWYALAYYGIYMFLAGFGLWTGMWDIWHWHANYPLYMGVVSLVLGVLAERGFIADKIMDAFFEELRQWFSLLGLVGLLMLGAYYGFGKDLWTWMWVTVLYGLTFVYAFVYPHIAKAA